MNYKLSPSDLTFLYDGCKRCFYQEVVNNIAQPVYRPAPTIHKELIEKYPNSAFVLNRVFQRLDRRTLQKLNARIAIEGEDLFLVANGYLHDIMVTR